MPFSRIAIVCAMATAAVAAGTTPAGAATTVGQLPAGTIDGGTCNGAPNWNVVQTGVAAGASYVVPSAGVLTSWSTTTSTDPVTMTLKVFRPTGVTNQYRAVATDPPLKTIPAGGGDTRTFPVRIAVQPGDLVGIWSQTGSCSVFTNDAADTIAFYGNPDELAPGSTATFTSGSSVRFNISAQLEPDADADQFGDESQDQCPATAGSQAGCPAPANTGSATTTSGGGGATNSAIDLVKPTLGSLGFSASAFKAAPSGSAFSAQKKRKSSAKVGTKVSFNLSEASAVKFTVQRKASGRRVAGKCKRRTKKNATKRKCTRWVKVPGSFTVAGKAGKNSFTFRGRVGGKSLKPGSYRLNSQATDGAKNKSAPKRKVFRIVK